MLSWYTGIFLDQIGGDMDSNGYLVGEREWNSADVLKRAEILTKAGHAGDKALNVNKSFVELPKHLQDLIEYYFEEK